MTVTLAASTLWLVTDLQLKIYQGLYRLMLLLAYPIAALRLRWRARREPEYGERISERYGRIAEAIPRNVIWFHAVSAGEVIASAPLLGALAERFPQRRFLMTTTTPTGAAQVRRLLSERYANVDHCFAPYDFAHVQKRFYARVAPALLVLVETELWPNQLNCAQRAGIGAYLVNGRLSERSAARYQLIRPLVANMLSSLRFLACQSDEHRRRFLALGAQPESTEACGSLKFDVELPDDHPRQVDALKSAWQLHGRFVWCAGSTHPGEDGQVLAAHERLLEKDPQALLILAPRHPTRCAEVALLLEQRQLRYARLSHGPQAHSRPQVLLVDTLGELPTLYGLSDIAFLGGSLVPVGGHNPIEAAVCCVPLLTGPQHFNFADVIATFAAADAIELVASAEQLAGSLLDAHADPDKRRRRGDAARQVVAENRGALAFLLERLSGEIERLNLTNDP